MKKQTLKNLLVLSTVAVTIGLAGCQSQAQTEESPAETSATTAAETTGDTQQSTDQSETGEAESAAAETGIGEVSLEDDFYDFVNKEWLESNEIPADKMMIGSFNDLNDQVDEVLMADFAKMIADGTEVSGPMQSYLAYYKEAMDFEKRDSLGAAPAEAGLKVIEDIKDYEEFKTLMPELLKAGYLLPASPTVMADMGNAEVYSLYFAPGTMGLGSKEYYDESNPAAAQILPVYETTIKDLFVLAGKSEEEAAEIAANTIAYDKLIAANVKDTVEASVIANMYNPISLEDLNSYSDIDFTGYISALVETVPEQVIVTDKGYYEKLGEIVNADNFEMIKDWMAANYLVAGSNYLSEDFRAAGAALNTIMTGATEMPSRELSAYNATYTLIGEIPGTYYGETYLGPEAKADVTGMVENIIAAYRNRLEANTWLSDDTKAKAATKLDTMKIKIGYPDEMDAFNADFTLQEYEDGGSFFQHYRDILVGKTADLLAKCGQEVNTDTWNTNGAVVNAYYSPMENSITFPAAVLQGQFYDLERSTSANYGGIGAVIAHEITHAFDSNGAMYDETGSLNNWWTEEDYTQFEQLTQEMVTFFDGLEHAGGQVNGTLTVSENIADAGGLRTALDAVKELPDGNLEEFFESYAVLWRTKITPQMEEMLLMTDVHAPNKLRTNRQLSNIDEFYETFGIEEGDGMYLAPEERVSIW